VGQGYHWRFKVYADNSGLDEADAAVSIQDGDYIAFDDVEVVTPTGQKYE
jgi:hypothetical protein